MQLVGIGVSSPQGCKALRNAQRLKVRYCDSTENENAKDTIVN